MRHRLKRGRSLNRRLILGSVPPSPSIAFLVHLLNEFDKIAEIIRTLSYFSGPDLLAPAVVRVVHQCEHRRPVNKCGMIPKAPKHMRAKHSLQPRPCQCPQTWDKPSNLRFALATCPHAIL